jgi:hypothetical protein
MFDISTRQVPRDRHVAGAGLAGGLASSSYWDGVLAKSSGIATPPSEGLAGGLAASCSGGHDDAKSQALPRRSPNRSGLPPQK